MSVSTNDFKNGMTLDLDGTLFQVVEFQHVKPGKGGAFVRTKLRNLRNGNLLEKTFNAGIKVEQAILEKRDMQFLYKDGSDFVFMDQESYDQSHVSPAALGEAADYLIESAVAIIATYQGDIVSVERAVQMNLVHEVVDDLDSHLGTVIATLLSRSSFTQSSVKAILTALEYGDDVSVIGRQQERASLTAGDLDEGLAAFREKRSPNFGTRRRDGL